MSQYKCIRTVVDKACIGTNLVAHECGNTTATGTSDSDNLGQLGTKLAPIVALSDRYSTYNAFYHPVGL